jgi:DNA repair protein RadA/Sms
VSRSTTYRCRDCGATATKWAGRCASCGEWNTLDESAAVDRRGVFAAPALVESLADLAQSDPRPRSTGVGEWDRVLVVAWSMDRPRSSLVNRESESRRWR